MALHFHCPNVCWNTQTSMSVLSFFIVYINDPYIDAHSTTKLLADDTIERKHLI